MSVPISTDDTFEVELGPHKVRFRHPSFRQARELRQAREGLAQFKTDEEYGEAVIRGWGPLAVDGPASLEELPMHALVLIPTLFERRRSASAREVVELTLLGEFGAGRDAPPAATPEPASTPQAPEPKSSST